MIAGESRTATPRTAGCLRVFLKVRIVDRDWGHADTLECNTCGSVTSDLVSQRLRGFYKETDSEPRLSVEGDHRTAQQGHSLPAAEISGEQQSSRGRGGGGEGGAFR